MLRGGGGGQGPSKQQKGIGEAPAGNSKDPPEFDSERKEQTKGNSAALELLTEK